MTDETVTVPRPALEFLLERVEHDIYDWYEPEDAKETAQFVLDIRTAMEPDRDHERLKEYATMDLDPQP